MEKIAAIILAAGYSSRMEKFKPLLSLGGTSVIERVIHLFMAAGIEDILVVVGFQYQSLVPLLERLQIRWVVNERFKDGMFSSVKTGIKCLAQDNKGFFMLPVDIPLVRYQTLSDLLKAFEKSKNKILYPCYGGRRGHPPLIAAHFIEKIVQWNGEKGLQGLLNQHEKNALEVAVTDENILFDMDTPEDYLLALSRYKTYHVPTVEACQALMVKSFAMNKETIRHCELVARVALLLGNALKKAGCRLNLELIVAAGLLHDIARNQPDHAETGARILERMGFPSVADIVREHIDIYVISDEPICEKEVVYLSDKLVSSDQVVDLETRFEEKKVKFADDSKAKAAIESRLKDTLFIKKRLEIAACKTLESMLAGQLEPDLSDRGLKDDFFAETRGD